MTSELEKKDKGENGLFWNGFSFFIAFPSHLLYFAVLFLLKQNEKAQKIKQEKEKKKRKTSMNSMLQRLKNLV